MQRKQIQAKDKRIKELEDECSKSRSLLAQIMSLNSSFSLGDHISLSEYSSKIQQMTLKLKETLRTMDEVSQKNQLLEESNVTLKRNQGSKEHH